MDVRLIRGNHNGDSLAGMAAALCTNGTNYAGALRHALNSGHDSVLEHVTFTFLVRGVSRALLAQLTRHRIASYSVQSQRYVDLGSVDGVVPASIRDNAGAMALWQETMGKVREAYRTFIDRYGIPREDARYITPQAAVTELVLTMNARELRHFFSLRCCNRAQWEIRALADEMLRICRECCPVIFADAGPGCVRGACPEEKPCGKPRKS